MGSSSSVNIETRYGFEGSPGVPAATTKRLASGLLRMKPAITSGRIRSAGEDVDSLTYVKDQRTSGSIEGVPDFTASADLFRLAFGTGVTSLLEETAEPGEFYAQETEYTPLQTRPTLTVEQGDSDYSSLIAAVFAKSFELGWVVANGDATLAMEFEGGPLQDQGGLIGTATLDTPRPAVAANLRVYIDDDFSQLGSTEYNVQSVKFSLGNLGRLDRLSGNVYETINLAKDATVEIKVKVADLAVEQYQKLLSSDLQFVRLEVEGALVPGSVEFTERIQVDAAVMNEDQGREDENEVYTATLTLRIVRTPAGFKYAARVRSAA